MKLVYFSVTSNEIPNLSEAIRLLPEQMEPLTVYARTRTQLENNPDFQAAFVSRAVSADALVVTLMAGSQSCPVWDPLIEALENRRANGRCVPYFHVQPTGSNAQTLALVEKYSDGRETGGWQTLSRYYRYGGVENLKHLLICLYNRVCGTMIECKAPVRPPYEGLYHPDRGYIEDLEPYRSALNPEKPTVGIWFYQNFWTSNNKAHIDAMVRDVEPMLRALDTYTLGIIDVQVDLIGSGILARRPVGLGSL